VARGYACSRHVSEVSCSSDPSQQCRWRGGPPGSIGGAGGGGGGSGGGGPALAAAVSGGLGRPCALDEAAQAKAVSDFYVSREFICSLCCCQAVLENWKKAVSNCWGRLSGAAGAGAGPAGGLLAAGMQGRLVDLLVVAGSSIRSSAARPVVL
jgi:hypothetical protein